MCNGPALCLAPIKSPRTKRGGSQRVQVLVGLPDRCCERHALGDRVHGGRNVRARKEKNENHERRPARIVEAGSDLCCADGTWMTRTCGYHSKNATFSIRNYFTSALFGACSVLLLSEICYYIKHVTVRVHCTCTVSSARAPGDLTKACLTILGGGGGKDQYPTSNKLFGVRVCILF